MQEHALRSLKSARGACPVPEQLVEFAALAPEARAGHPTDTHVQLCSRCQLVLLHLEEPATETRAPSWSVPWMLPIAAALVLAVGATLVYRGVSPAPGGVDAVRGTELQPVAPAGAVGAVRSIEWHSPITAFQYRVSIFRGSSTAIWSGTSRETRLTPGITLPPGDYEWQVEAMDREGSVRMSSPRQAFSIR